MGFRSILTVFCTVALFSASVKGDEPSACTADYQRGSCVCHLADGSGTLDLTPLQAQTKQTPLEGPDVAGLNYYYFIFCDVMTNRPQYGLCNNFASVCETRKDNPTYNYDIGDASSTRFEVRTSKQKPVPQVAIVTDTDRTLKSRTVAFLTCDPGTSNLVFTSQGNQGDKEDGYTLFYMEVRGAGVCPQVGGLSGGSILLIIFFSLLFAYIVGGVILMTFVYKKEGIERIPNVHFWIALPGLAKEGVLFTWNTLRQCCTKSGYTPQ